MASHNVLVASKDEYTTQLCNYLYTAIYQGLKSIWNDSKRASRTDPNSPNALKNFQDRLALIPKWNQDAIDEEYERIVSETHIEYYDKLITAVFLANVQVLSAIRTGKEKEIKLKVPKAKVFIHKCYVQCARELYPEPQLFDDRMGQVTEYGGVSYEEPTNIDTGTAQKNFRESLNLINRAIQKTIRDLLPIQYILDQYLNDESEGEGDDEGENSENSDGEDDLKSNGSNKSSKSGGGDEDTDADDESGENGSSNNKIADAELLERDFDSLQNPAKAGDSDTEFPVNGDRPSTPHAQNLPPPVQQDGGEVKQISISKEALSNALNEDSPVELPLPPLSPGPPSHGDEPTFFSDAESD